MIDQQTPYPIEVPSMAKIVTATVTALIVACVILATVVLPAEYGIDPLGTGKKLGLTDLAKAPETSARQAAASDKPASSASEVATIVPVLEPSPTGDAPKMKGVFIAQPKRFQVDSREITFAPGEGLEIKYNMKKGAGLVYSWTSTGILSYEFHGEPDVKPKGSEGTDYFESYDLDDKVGKDQSHGTFVAPSTGIHGWFWENKTGKSVTLKLVSAGFYEWILQNRKNKQLALKPMDAYALPSHPTIPDEVLR
jgi:hypothetical protein